MEFEIPKAFNTGGDVLDEDAVQGYCAFCAAKHRPVAFSMLKCISLACIADTLYELETNIFYVTEGNNFDDVSSLVRYGRRAALPPTLPHRAWHYPPCSSHGLMPMPILSCPQVVAAAQRRTALSARRRSREQRQFAGPLSRCAACRQQGGRQRRERGSAPAPEWAQNAWLPRECPDPPGRRRGRSC